MTADVELLEIADELYGLPLPEFTPARDARVKELKGTPLAVRGEGAEEAVDRGLGRQPARPPRHRAGRAGAHRRRGAARGPGVDVGRRAAGAQPAAASADRRRDDRCAADRPRGGHPGHRGGRRPGRGDADGRDGRRALRTRAAQRDAHHGAGQHRARPGRRGGGGGGPRGAGLRRPVARRGASGTTRPARRTRPGGGRQGGRRGHRGTRRGRGCARRGHRRPRRDRRGRRGARGARSAAPGRDRRAAQHASTSSRRRPRRPTTSSPRPRTPAPRPSPGSPPRLLLATLLRRRWRS